MDNLPINRNQPRNWLWLFIVVLASIGATSIMARQIINLPADEFIDKAEVVAIAVIEKMTEKKSECQDSRDYKLRPVEALKGKLTDAMKQVSHLQTDRKSGKGCIEESYSVPPWTKTREVGAKVIAVINYVDSLKEYRATATFDLSELDKIKKRISGEKP